MILIIGHMARYESAFQQSLYNLCAELCKQSLLKGCLIVYPPEPADRAWIPPFINSLRSVGIQRVNLLISTASFSPADIEEIEGMGVYEIIFAEEVDLVHFIDTRRIGIRVWLNAVNKGVNHDKICRWYTFVKNLLSIERAPLAFSEVAQPQISVWKEADLPESYCLPEPWSSRLPLRIIGATGGPEALIAPPEWLFMPDKVPDANPADRQYFDFVKDDLGKMTERKRLTLQQDFLHRIQQNAQTYFQ
jgi:hypothetical protein